MKNVDITSNKITCFYLNAQEIISQELSETLRLGEDFQLKEEIDEKENIFQKDIKRLIEKKSL